MRELEDGDYMWAAEMVNLINRGPESLIKIVEDFEPAWDGNMDVLVQGGTVEANYTQASAAAQPLTHDTEAVLDVRYDLITVDNTANVSITKGTGNRVAPAMPAGEALIAIVRIQKGVSDLTAGDVFDARIVHTNNVVAEGSGTITQVAMLLQIQVNSDRPIIVAYKTNETVAGFLIRTEIETLNVGVPPDPDEMLVNFHRLDGIAQDCDIEYRIMKI